ncbi:MAG: CARDB domain-containing protein [Bradyrhizobium sp.]
MAPGTYYIGGIADYNNAIAEGNETNNNREATRITVTGPAQPDLVAALDSVSSTTIAAGGSTSLDYWLVNFGKASASGSTTGIYVSTDATITSADILLTTIGSTGLAANGASGYYDHQTLTLTMPSGLAPGTYYIGAIADYTSAVTEGNEANNNYEATRIVVTGPAQPDLVAALDSVSSTTVAAGGSTSLDYWLVNFGKASVSGSTTGIYISTDATVTTADTLLTTVGSTGLAVNGASGYYDHQTLTLTMPGGLAPGTYYIGAIADYTNAVAEGNEANNNHEATRIIVTGPAQPDLVAALDSVSSTTIAVGGSTSLDYWLVNFGKASVSGSTTGIYISTDATITTADTLLTTVGSTGLAVNGAAGYYDHQTLTVTVPSGLAPGTYYIGAIADYTNAVAEGNKANNNHEATRITVTTSGNAATAVSNHSASSDTFVFVTDLGQTTNNSSDQNHIQADHTAIFAPPSSTQGVGADAHGFVPQDTAIAVLLQHYLSDFHFV